MPVFVCSRSTQASTITDNWQLYTQGLAAISAILQQSGSKWWMGSRLQSLELCSDCRQAPSTAAVVSPQPLSSPLPQADDPQHLSSSSSPQQCSSQRPASAPPERQRVECNAARQPAVGACDTPGASTAGWQHSLSLMHAIGVLYVHDQPVDNHSLDMCGSHCMQASVLPHLATCSSPLARRMCQSTAD